MTTCINCGEEISKLHYKFDTREGVFRCKRHWDNNGVWTE